MNSEDIPLTPMAKMALVGIMTGDRGLAPAGAAMLKADAQRRKRLTHIGNGFLLDEETGAVSQDPTYAKYVQGLQDRIDARQQAGFGAAEQRQATRDASALERVTAGIDARERTAQATKDREDNARAEREAQWLAKMKATNGLDELEQSVKELDDAIAPYVQRGGDIPGIGGVSNFDAVANLGGSQSRLIHAKYAAVRNAILKARSGGAVTEGEADRLLTELGNSVMFGDKDFLANWQSVKNRVAAKSQNLEAGISPQAVDLYHHRRGSQSTYPESTPAQGSRVTLNGKQYEKVNGQWHEVTDSGP